MSQLQTFFYSKLKKQNSIMVLDIFEDNTVCMDDSVQGGNPVTHAQGVQVSVSPVTSTPKLPFLVIVWIDFPM